jgi:hypothetical protein
VIGVTSDHRSGSHRQRETVTDGHSPEGRQMTGKQTGGPAGSYTLSFAAGSDPTTHTAQFVVP